MKIRNPLFAVAAAAALAIPIGGIALAQEPVDGDTPASLLAECDELGPQDSIVENPNLDERKEIINPDYNVDVPPLIDDTNTADGEEDDPDTLDVNEATTDPNPKYDDREVIENPDYDPATTVENELYEPRLDPSGNGIACGIEDVAGWEALIEEPVETTTPEPTETTTPTPVDPTTTCADFDDVVLADDPAYHEGLDADLDGIGCEANGDDGVTPTETTTPETTSPAETTPAPAQSQTQSQSVVIVPNADGTQGSVERDPANRVPLQSVPSGPITR